MTECLGVIILIVLRAVIKGWVFMLLWNWLAPMVWTNAPVLTIWMSIGILWLINIISRFLFGSK